MCVWFGGVCWVCGCVKGVALGVRVSRRCAIQDWRGMSSYSSSFSPFPFIISLPFFISFLIFLSPFFFPSPFLNAFLLLLVFPFLLTWITRGITPSNQLRIKPSCTSVFEHALRIVKVSFALHHVQCWTSPYGKITRYNINMIKIEFQHKLLVNNKICLDFYTNFVCCEDIWNWRFDRPLKKIMCISII